MATKPWTRSQGLEKLVEADPDPLPMDVHSGSGGFREFGQSQNRPFALNQRKLYLVLPSRSPSFSPCHETSGCAT